MKESKSRIKRLKGISDPDYRLRVGNYRIFYNVTEDRKSRIKRLKGISDPDYRLRVGNYRIFYNVTEDRVDVLRVMHKEETYK